MQQTFLNPSKIVSSIHSQTPCTECQKKSRTKNGLGRLVLGKVTSTVVLRWIVGCSHEFRAGYVKRVCFLQCLVCLRFVRTK